jgi:predicted phosphate transport protein (TIGR00153 family)
MPTPNPFLQLFGRSPIRPLQEHIDKVYECAQQLMPFFQAVLANDWEKASRIQHVIAELENQADVLKKELRLNLPKGLFLPVPRTDLLDMLRSQDRIANKAKDIAGLILGRKMQIPSELALDLEKFLQRSIDATAQAHKSIHELDSLLETGFSGHEISVVEEMIDELDAIESDTDEMQIRIRQKLYEVEKDLPPIDTMFLYSVIEWIGELANRAQRVGGQLQLLIAR